MLGVFEKFMRGVPLDNLTEIHEKDPVGHALGKSHFMRNHDHGHPFPGQIDHNIQDFFDHFRVKGGGGFIKKHDFRIHTKASGNCYTLLLSAWKLPRIFSGLLWNENLFQITDYQGYKDEFLKLFGFGIEGVDYDKDVDTLIEFEPVTV